MGDIRGRSLINGGGGGGGGRLHNGRGGQVKFYPYEKVLPMGAGGGGGGRAQQVFW